MDLVERLRAERCTNFDKDWGRCGECKACVDHLAADRIEALETEKANLQSNLREAVRFILAHGGQAATDAFRAELKTVE